MVSPFNSKARLWINGRINIFEKLEKTISPIEPLIWFHCASLGEFEQGRPIIEGLKKSNPEFKILVTFFSPSGYEIRKNYEMADYIFYLPKDSPTHVKQFLNIVKPRLAVFIKYEFWFNYLNEMNKREIPIIIASAIFRPDQHFFKVYGYWFRKQLSQISFFFVQNKKSLELLESIGIKNIVRCGDTRIDRVWDISKNVDSFPLVEKFKGNSRLMIFGSTWPPDEELVFELLKTDHYNLKIIVVPHNVDKSHVDSIMKNIHKKVLKYSEANDNNIEDAEVLIVDSIGILNRLYQYADLTYIGGGFGVSIHNILEPATFGCPVIFGPKHQKFQEALDLIELGGGFAVDTATEFLKIFQQLMTNNEMRQNASSACKNYINNNRGATEIILKKLKDFI